MKNFKGIGFGFIFLLLNMVVFMVLTIRNVLPTFVGFILVISNFVIAVDILNKKDKNEDETL